MDLQAKRLANRLLVERDPVEPVDCPSAPGDDVAHREEWAANSCSVEILGLHLDAAALSDDVLTQLGGRVIRLQGFDVRLELRLGTAAVAAPHQRSVHPMEEATLLCLRIEMPP